MVARVHFSFYFIVLSSLWLMSTGHQSCNGINHSISSRDWRCLIDAEDRALPHFLFQIIIPFFLTWCRQISGTFVYVWTCRCKEPFRTLDFPPTSRATEGKASSLLNWTHSSVLFASYSYWSQLAIYELRAVHKCTLLIALLGDSSKLSVNFCYSNSSLGQMPLWNTLLPNQVHLNAAVHFGEQNFLFVLHQIYKRWHTHVPSFLSWSCPDLLRNLKLHQSKFWSSLI